MRRTGRVLTAVGVVLGLAGGAGRAGAGFLGPTPYLSAGDSPLLALPFSAFYLETFESGALAVPGVTVTAGWTVNTPGRLTDSVDADDAAIDGLGRDGHSFYSGGQNATLTVTFDAAVLGSLPTAAGIVWTDVGFVTSGTNGFGDVTFSATGPGGASLGSIGPFTLGDGSSTGETPEDRFFGVTNAAGIESITISMSNSTDWEVDHLQFLLAPAAAVPEPGSLALVAAGG
ncbi:MAG: hypothetical protein K2X82_01760, partial [Gemmataceae bacterium]|nr:hypothetical protein [Gemmataceae bacterium]